MQLAIGTDALKSEIQEIVGDSLQDPLTASYVSELLVSPPIGTEEIRLNFIGLRYSEFPEMKLAHSREMGDRCLAIGIFYLEDLEREGQYLLDLLVEKRY